MRPLACILLSICVISRCDDLSIRKENVESTDIAKQVDPRLLVFSTLDGHLFGIEQETGNVRWKIKDRAVVKVPKDVPNAIIPLFLPDPCDGSLYLVGNQENFLKKLPFKIPELVTSSPCRSSDGILYTGKKKDTWFTIDPKTGERQHIIGWDTNGGSTCPVKSADAVYVGRTEYSLMMVDSKDSNKKWNISFYEYSSIISKETLANYEMVHFTSTSSGSLITLDRIRATTLWEKDLGSPIVGAYILDPQGFISLPFTSLSNHTLHNFSPLYLKNKIKFYPTLYIGEHSEGLYATPSYVDKSVVTISSMEGKPLLLDSPDSSRVHYISLEYPLPGHNYYLPQEANDAIFQSIAKGQYSIIHLGHYNLPDFTQMKLQISGRSPTMTKLITDKSDNKWVQTDSLRKDLKSVDYPIYIIIATILAVFAGTVFYYMKITKIETPINESNIEKIGKIIYDPEKLIGKGSDGTVVFCGEFESRKVAIKRLLPECFTFADKEVELLKESDTHPNVIRYFCTEQTKFFKYIALELCQATLADYVQGTCPQNISPLKILEEATSGLEHLHSLNIVHRDIKPQNVLLSMPSASGHVRAMISDFGLCKKLQSGRTSFSKKSGLSGTQGWIAPELLTTNQTTVTRAVDMFSLGCLYYYVLSGGEHPFGDIFQRQSNILSGTWKLDEIRDEDWKIKIYKPLIKALISAVPKERPSCSTILAYPIFWNNSAILSFLQDVSDRVEKADQTDPILNALETNGQIVVKNDWRLHIDDEVAIDLRKYRSYRGDSLRDLLRALRNKKHHYHELSLEAQNKLGDIPNGFTSYWTIRFPLLFIHTWISMQILSTDETFKQHYKCPNYLFPKDLINYKENEHICDSRCSKDEEVEVHFKTQKNKPKYKSESENKFVGLYRNVNNSDLKVQTSNNSRWTNRSPNKKKTKQNDVPLTWVLPS